MIALRAARKAIRIARDLLYPTVNMNRVYCHGCHRQLDWQAHTGIHYLIFCPDCGATTELPCHLRPSVTHPQDVPLADYAADHEPRRFAPWPREEDLSMPPQMKRALITFVAMNIVIAILIVLGLVCVWILK